jgi:hypothetical protein
MTHARVVECTRDLKRVEELIKLEKKNIAEIRAALDERKNGVNECDEDAKQQLVHLEEKYKERTAALARLHEAHRAAYVKYKDAKAEEAQSKAAASSCGLRKKPAAKARAGG